MWSIHTFTTKPANNFLQTFRPPLFNIFRPHSSSNTLNNNENQSNAQSTSLNNINTFYNKPTFRPPTIVRPTVSTFNNLNNLQPYYSTRTTPFLTNTQSMNYQFEVTQSSASVTSTTTEQPFLISPTNLSNNNSLPIQSNQQAASNQNLTNVSFSTNESSSITVTNSNGQSNQSNQQMQNAPANYPDRGN